MTIEALYQLFSAGSGVCTDSRSPLPGSIFFALKGEHFNGNRYAADALRGGCRYAVVDEPIPNAQADSRIIYTPRGVLPTLSALATYHRDRLGTPVIAITGTNGKTTTKELLAAVLAKQYNVLYTQGNLNNQVGVPLTLLRLKPEHQLAVIEMGANHPNDIRDLVQIAHPNYGIITNIGKAHLQGFGSLEGVKKAKGALYDYIRATQGVLFVHTDDHTLAQMARGIKAVSYGTSEGNAAVRGTLLPESQEGLMRLGWSCPSMGPDQEGSCQTHLVGRYNLPNALAAVAAGCFFGVPAPLINQALEEYTPDNSRSQLIPHTALGNRLVVDAYNANPSSMRPALDNLLSMPLTGDLRDRVLLLGDMNELGAESQAEHTRVLEYLQRMPRAFTAAYLCGPCFYALKDLFAAPNLHFYPHTQALREALTRHPLRSSLILLKGSNSLHIASLAELC